MSNDITEGGKYYVPELVNEYVGIYKITSPTNRVYIGQSVNIDKRKNGYKKGKCKGQKRLNYSIIKYGWEAHIFKVLEYCLIERLNERERFWQDHYNVLGPDGLNCRLTTTLDKTGFFSVEAKRKMSLSHVGHTVKESTKEKLRIAFKNRVFSADTKMKISLSRKGKNFRNGKRLSQESKNKLSKKNSKPVVQKTTNNEFVMEYLSANAASIVTGVNFCAISMCCNNKRQTAGGFKWCFSENTIRNKSELSRIMKMVGI